MPADQAAFIQEAARVKVLGGRGSIKQQMRDAGHIKKEEGQRAKWGSGDWPVPHTRVCSAAVQEANKARFMELRRQVKVLKRAAAGSQQVFGAKSDCGPF